MDWKRDLTYRVVLSAYMIFIYASFAAFMRAYATNSESCA